RRAGGQPRKSCRLARSQETPSYSKGYRPFNPIRQRSSHKIAYSPAISKEIGSICKLPGFADEPSQKTNRRQWEECMSDIIDVADVIERQGRNGVVLTVVILSTAIMFLDGYDLQAMAFAAPSIIRAWGIDKAALGVVFSAGIFGILVGGLLFGSLGDRIG